MLATHHPSSVTLQSSTQPEISPLFFIMAAPKILIFGPTGNVGSWVARTAQAQGAKVYFAMRDTTKTIPSISPEEEKKGGYERVQADLSQPETLHKAVKSTGATRAFIYLIHSSTDGMRSAITALKEAGITFIVFLSSYAVQEEKRAVGTKNWISWAHAQVEISLEDVFGPSHYVALRPAYFATNSLAWVPQIKSGNTKLRIPVPESKFDWIAPEDMGRVAASILVRGSLTTASGEPDTDAEDPKGTYIYLMGPQILAQADALKVIGRAIGKEFSVEALSDEEAFQYFVDNFHVNADGAKGLVNTLKDTASGAVKEFSSDPMYEKRAANTLKYSGVEPTPFEKWVGENKSLYA
ncbi:hypothetical protein B0H63DRAFT_490125 [Podospora didyma]|uniref:NmrA-like domain-containing protein n=1 Tax=Podospora didyma TaxID=330526 RepID=A0AAE0K247_9PEZI|nr:hypothetical protein B0H63DRAFT_490125 [Podospora didyma]